MRPWLGGIDMAETSKDTAIRLIQSDDSEPLVRLTPGRRFEVAAVPIVDRNLDEVTDDAGDEVRPARLCGSRSTCLAIVEIE
jgi:hypothetical protein